MALNLAPIKKAYASLSKALERALQNRDDLEVRDGCIQRFEYTYELSIKFVKRYIETESATPENVDQLNFRDLLRTAAEIGLVKDVNSWFSFREARNNTSHAYDEIKANEVFSVIPSFANQVEFLINELEKRIK